MIKSIQGFFCYHGKKMLVQMCIRDRMKAFHMMENREDVAVARATAGMIMMANSKEGGQSETI